MLDLSCLCGAVRLELANRPEYVNACNCTLCCKTGAHWAYFPPGDLAVAGTTAHYTRQDKPDAGAQVHFCPTCGVTTHFTLTPAMIAVHGNTMVGVNIQLADAPDLAGVELRYPDGRGWAGSGEFSYLREASTYGA